MKDFPSCGPLLKNVDRIRALKETGLFGTAPEEAFERLNRLATKLLKAPISIFSLIGEESQFFKSAAGFDITPDTNEVPIDISVCMYSLQGKPLTIENTSEHPLFSDNPAVKAMNIVGYLGIPVITRDGHPIGAVCVIDHKARQWSADDISILEEITSSFLSEIELRQAVKKAERETKIREEFISVASHELKNPLSVLKLQAQFHKLKMDKQNLSTDEQQSFLNKMERQIQRLSLLVDDMTDITRLNRGDFTLKKESMNLTNLVREVLQNYEETLQSSDMKLSVDLEENILGEWDHSRLEQVIVNLITNAAKYAPGSELNVSLRKMGKRVSLNVTDNGPGISLENQGKIFKKFERAKNDANVKGLGLGLFIARKIVEQHGGELNLKSELGKGSAFELNLSSNP
jgi:K+-sensing histidine kinase KdpD